MLYNKSTGKLILKKTRLARGFLEKFKGLMLAQKIDFALVFELGRESRLGASIHMLFMRQAIDVLFLNRQKRIVDLVESLQPWTLNYTPKKPAAFIVELPSGTIKKQGLRLGQELQW